MGSPTKTGKTPYTGPRYCLSHPQLGDLTGRLVNSAHFPESPVVQFRSVPYATVQSRFRPSLLQVEIPSDFDKRPHRDFTNFGAACPQLGGQHPSWCDPWAGPLEDDDNLEFDEFSCLTVSISVPESQLASATNPRLPVVVYIHGGGASEGTGHVDGLHSNAPLTSYAASIGQPVVTVNIGYRLGWFGSLVCQDMLDDFATAPTSAYGPFNLAHQDQRNAFAWVSSFIGGFGGDNSNITAFGESAGSTFLTYHICGSAERLFDRAILQSGLIFGHTTFEVKEEEYQAMLKHFKIEGMTPAERLDALRKVDVQSLLQVPGSHMTPYIDAVPGVDPGNSLFARGRPTVINQVNLIATCEWLGDLVVGDDFWEGHIFHHLLEHCPQSLFIETVKSVFPGPEAEALLAAYKMATMEEGSSQMQMSLFIGDMMFSAPSHGLCNLLGMNGGSKKRSIYRYSFAMSNPFSGTAFSSVTGHHFLEILFIFLTLLDRYPTDRNGWVARQAKEMSRRWIMFANGKSPWEPYIVPSDGDVGQSKIAICDDLVGWTVRTLDEDEEVSKEDPWGERRYAGWRALAAAYDALKVDGESSTAYNHKITMLRLRFMQLAYGVGGLVKQSELETRGPKTCGSSAAASLPS